MPIYWACYDATPPTIKDLYIPAVDDAPLWGAFTGLHAEFGKATKREHAALKSTFSAEGKFFRVMWD